MKNIVILVDHTLPPPVSLSDIEAAIASGKAEVVVPKDEPQARPPTLLQKAANFASSAAKHIASGAPRASQEQVDARFAICQSCELFDGKACTQCGCPIIRERQFVSKLSWANEKCPVGKWGPVQAP